MARVADVVRVQPPTDEELLEQWTRTGPDAELTAVEAVLPEDHPWQVIVSMAEFVRADPLASRMAEAVVVALQAVPGVTEVAREDTEVWLAWGTPAGDDLVRAVASVVDGLAAEAREELEGEHWSAPASAPAQPVSSPSNTSTRSIKLPVDRKPLLWAGALAAIGLVQLIVGLSTSDRSTTAFGVFSLLFFGGGGGLLLVRHFHDR